MRDGQSQNKPIAKDVAADGPAQVTGGANILIIGDSHTRALKWAKSARASGWGNVSIYMVGDGQKRPADINRVGAAELIANLSESDTLVFSWLGARHNVLGLLNGDPPFCVGPPPKGLNGRQMIPTNLMLDVFRHDHGGAARWFKKLIGGSKARVFHLSTPPPKGDDAWIASKVEVYRDRAVKEVGINRADQRRLLYELEMVSLEEFCRANGMTLIPAPAEAVEGGFLKREYWHDDATHANEAYGALVLRQIEALAH